MRFYGDIKKLNGYDLPSVDIITGGSPCQDLSLARYGRTGLDGERSGLFLEQLRIVKEMREKTNGRKARFLVWENVKGAFSANGGRDFQRVLTEIIKICEPNTPDVPMPDKGAWSKSGCLYDALGKWSVAWRLHNSEFWGVPQRRDRISVVADYGGMCAPEVLFERKGLHWNPEESEIEEERIASTVESSTGKTGEHSINPILIEMTSTKNTIIENGICPTLTARMGTGGNQVNAVCVGNGQLNQISMSKVANTLDTMHDQQAILIQGADYSIVRRLTPLEVERLQGFPDGWTDIGEWIDSKGKRRKSSDSARYRALGNALALPFWKILARRIAAQYDRPVTMGGLFSGIGGFEYAFQQCGVKPMFVSEIEDFPMAVLQYHFGSI